MQPALIFANGDIADGPMVQQVLGQAQGALVIAADGGARLARGLGLHVDYVIGDMDSVSAAELDMLQAQGTEIQRHPEEKNETDLELALTFAAQRGVTWMRILGGVGGRLDQTLANIYLLALPALVGRDVRLVDGAQETWLLHPGENIITGTAGDTLSLIPLSDAVRGIRTEQLYYPLRDETLTTGPARGISNMLQADEARVWMREGRLLAVRTIGRA